MSDGSKRTGPLGPLIAAALSILALTSCTGVNVLNAITPKKGFSVAKDLEFGGAGLHLDVYTPDAAQAATVVVFFYGGSWQSATTLNKHDYAFVGQALAAQGFVAVLADYRLFPDVRFPSFVEDCADAVKWAHDNAAQYGGDPQKLVVMGHSAGAYNAAMLVLDPGYLRRAGADRSWVRGMVGLAGPYDFLPLLDENLKVIFGPVASRPATMPINHVDGSNPPMLLLAGENDEIVYAKNTVNLLNKIRVAGGTAQDIIYPKMGHIKMVVGLASALPGQDKVMLPVATWIRDLTESPAP